MLSAGVRHDDPRPNRSAGSVLLVYYFTNAVAEAMQGVAILWATYELAHNSLLVGVVNAVAYLPGVVTGLAFRRRADRGHAARLLGSTNWMLAVGSAILVVIWFADEAPAPLIWAFVVVQVTLSVTKMMNKAYVARFVRDQFGSALAKRVLEHGTSLTMVGGLIGGACAGVLLDTASAGVCFAGAAVLYLASLAAVQVGIGRLAPVPAAPPSPDEPDQPVASAAVASPASAPNLQRLLWLVLLFSIPSSGAIPFVSTILVPLAQKTAPGSGLYYSILTIVCALGGFVAGQALARRRLGPSPVLNLALPAAAVLAAILAPVAHGVVAIAVLILVVSAVLTAHVILMQVLTNQAPPREDVGRFTVLRNAFANSAKGGFSLACGALVQLIGLSGAWLVLAGVLAGFGAVWGFVPRCAILRLAA